MYKHCFFIGLFFVNFLFIHAQNPQPNFRNYTTDDGLPSSSFHAFAQDSKGYVWFGSSRGLVRFDGYEFKTFTAADGLAGRFTNWLEEDEEGKMWIGELGGGLYYYENDSIYAFAHNDIIKSFKEDYYLQGSFTYNQQDSAFYIQLSLMGVLKIDKKGNHQIYRVNLPEIGSIMVDLGDEMVFSQSRDKNYKDQQEQIKVVHTKRIKEKRSPNIHWIKADTTHIIRNLYYSKDQPFNQGTQGFRIKENTFLYLNKGTVWLIENGKISFSSEYPLFTQVLPDKRNGNGFYISFSRNSQVRYYENITSFKQKKYKTFLSGIRANKVGKDIDDGLWILSDNNGIYYSQDEKFEVYNRSTGLSDDYISTFSIKNDSVIFLGLGTNEIIELNIKNNDFKTTYPAQNLNSNYDLHFNATTATLFGKFYLGIYKSNKWQEWLYAFPEYNMSEHPYYTKKIVPSHDSCSIYILGGYGNFKLNTQTLKPSAILPNFGKTGMVKDKTFSLYEQKNNTVWLGKSTGLWKWRGDSLIKAPLLHPAFNQLILAIKELKDSTLVIATYGEGILFWKDDKVQQLLVKDGLSSNIIDNLFVDEQDVIWAGSNQGLNKINRQKDGQFSIKKLTIRNGLPSNEIHKVRRIGEKVIVATSKGLAIFKEPALNTKSTSPFFTKITLDGQKINPTQLNQFSYDNKKLALSFVTINYKMDGAIPYRYKLNQHGNWIYTQQRELNLYNLAPDDYQFEVQSQNEDGYWSKSLKYDFIISPPFWSTSWFTALWLLGISSIGYLWYKNRLKRIQNENQLEREMNELKRSALQSQMNPHFIFNCLNSIQNFIAQNDSDNAIRYLAQFATLVRGILTSSTEKEISLDTELKILKNYLGLEQLRFPNKFQYRIDIAENINPISTFIPPMLTQPFIENAIKHGISSLEENGLITIKYKNISGYLEVSIQDNGKGIYQNQNTSNKGYKSIGINVTERRMELINISQKNIIISEVKTDKGEVVGTKVTLKFKL